jgi:hypothetical protein
MFDVFGCWRVVGRNKFKFLKICALIVLAKPIDNGSQERVFSRGTFTDNQLQRNMKESTFECAILEGINCDVVDKYIGIYTQKEKVSKEVIAEILETFWSTKARPYRGENCDSKLHPSFVLSGTPTLQ